MKIKEIFWSLQGEGLRIGFPSVFLRMAGCNLKCPFCDTKGSWENGRDMAIHKIIKDIDKYRKKYPQSQVVITGGEPLEQDLSPLVDVLKKKNYFISIETNGLHFQELAIDWWTVSPKDVADYFIHQELVKKIKAGDRVVTNGGIHGTIAGVKESTVFLKISDNVKIEINRTSVGEIIAQK